MRKDVEIGGKTVTLEANAATPYRYRMLFHKDLLTLLSGARADDPRTIDIMAELAFVMAKQAEKADMSALTEPEYLTWLEGFEPEAFLSEQAVLDILGVYNKNAVATSTAKKKAKKSPAN